MSVFNGLELGSHLVGSCMINQDRKHGFINIPKCASTLLKRVTSSHGYRHVGWNKPYKPDESYAFTVVIREPWGRYLAGLSEYVSRYYNPNIGYGDIYDKIFVEKAWCKYETNKLVLEMMGIENNDLFILDEHSTPYQVFVEPFFANEIKIFMLDRSDFSVLDEYLSSFFGTSIDSKVLPNQMSLAPKRKLAEYLGKRLSERKDGWLETWREIFIDDLEWRWCDRARLLGVAGAHFLSTNTLVCGKC